MRICAFKHCSNSTYTLGLWSKNLCSNHNVIQSDCGCPQPFLLFPFPTEKQDPEARREWAKAVNRKDAKSGKNWQPVKDSRVCSLHFVDGKPTVSHPNPSINLSEDNVAGASETPKPRRAPPKERPIDKQNVVQSVPSSNDLIISVVDLDHDYTDNRLQDSECYQCVDKSLRLKHFKELLKSEQDHENLDTDDNSKSASIAAQIFLKSDAKVKTYTGLRSKEIFNSLVSYFERHASNVKYWNGESKTNSRKRKRSFVSTPQKAGPSRKLSVSDELLLTLLKLRHNMTNEMLSDIFGISKGTTSQVFNTWVKLLADQLKQLIFWPTKGMILHTFPKSLTGYPNLRCTIDCTEVFIERPRDLENQALTWSDYKKHNTIKFLVGIAPNGMISFLSKVWGGRVSDPYITKKSGFLDLIEYGDLILADRGFTIQEELLTRGAHLKIPPSSSGKEQITKEDVKATKKIANARIHVERAIGRMKQFSILSNVLPITLLPLADDIVTVCACLCNMLPPLVK